MKKIIAIMLMCAMMLTVLPLSAIAQTEPTLLQTKDKITQTNRSLNSSVQTKIGTPNNDGVAFNDNFDEPWTGEGWSKMVNNTEHTWEVNKVIPSLDPKDYNDNMAYCSYDEVMAQDEILMSPTFSITGLDKPYLSFNFASIANYIKHDEGYFNFRILASLDGGSSYIEDVAIFDLAEYASEHGGFRPNSWITVNVEIPFMLRSNTFALAFRYEGVNGYYVFLDDIKVGNYSEEIVPTFDAPEAEMNGFNTFSDSFYSFSTKTPAKVSDPLLTYSYDIFAGELVDGEYYCIDEKRQLSIINTSDWTIEKALEEYAYDVEDMCYDSTRDWIVMSLETPNSDASGWVSTLAIFDRNTYTYQELGIPGGQYGGANLYALACDDQGNYYGIAPNGWLLKINIDLVDSAWQVNYTKIYETNITPRMVQSMAWDHEHQALYWAAYDEYHQNSQLYFFDVSRPSKIRMEFVGEMSGEICALTFPTDKFNSARHRVRFIDYDGTVVSEQMIKDGDRAKTPETPFREGYVFLGWSEEYEEVHSDMDIYAIYRRIGDVDLNGVVEAADATQVLRSVAGLIRLSKAQRTEADLDGDGYCTSNDATLILRYVAGLDK